MESTREGSLFAMLTAVEDASPVQAVEAVTRELGDALGARTVSFLIADLSGRALVRLAYIPFGGTAPGSRREGDEAPQLSPRHVPRLPLPRRRGGVAARRPPGDRHRRHPGTHRRHPGPPRS